MAEKGARQDAPKPQESGPAQAAAPLAADTPANPPETAKKVEGVKVQGKKYTEVSNNFRQPLNINGVDIPAGRSADVPDFDAEKPLMKAWLKAKVISV